MMNPQVKKAKRLKRLKENVGFYGTLAVLLIFATWYVNLVSGATRAFWQWMWP